MTAGRIVSFYSLQGGVGRSMIVADLAWILASHGYRVLTIDWNFEAPGLGEYLYPFLPDNYHDVPGVIDVLWENLLETMRTPRGDGARHLWLDASAQRVNWLFPGDGRLDFVSSGRTATAPTRVPLFPWDAFVQMHGGAQFIDATAARLRASFDYVLIDGRTGLADSLGVCTVRLPDVLVCPFSMVGNGPQELSAYLSLILEQRATRPLRVFPVPTGVQLGEKALLERMRTKTRRALAALPGIDRRYWDDVEVPYQIFYAYQRMPSVFGDRPGSPFSVLSVMEHLAARVSEAATASFPELPESDRQLVLAAYSDGPKTVASATMSGPPIPFDGVGDFLFVSYKREEFARVVLTLAQLTDVGYRVWWDAGISGGEEWERRLQERIAACRCVLVFLSEQAVASEHVRAEMQAARRLGKPIVPVRLDRRLEIPAIESVVGKLQLVDDSGGQPSLALEGALRFALGRQ